ncbi:MAG: 30S ribosomal protein S3 [Candidatus Parcubacteria bacterium]|nr:30S ribosomal protein S3 [Patescibacteria group bacterium]BCX16138.1 MAG: 30S ribosomal protein S3 [Candidatus Parcubacteria bacterium]
MGQKIKPTLLRLGITKDWKSKWFPKNFKFGRGLFEDFLIRQIIRQKIEMAGLDSINIEKTANNYKILIKAARPGLIIGRGGKGVEELTELISKEINLFRKKAGIKEKAVINLSVEEVKRYEASAQIIAQNIAWDIEKRMPFRKTAKKYLEKIMQSREVKGAKIKVSGRLDGAEISRSEWFAAGSLPLQTLRADIDYGEATAFTTYGTVGIKVWIYKGEILKNQNQIK